MFLEAEFGSRHPINTFGSSLYDTKGCKIEIPSCLECQCLMTAVIGVEAYQWICLECACKVKPEDPLTKAFIGSLTI